MKSCDPLTCYDLKERAAIMEHDAGIKVGLVTHAIKGQCESCHLLNGRRLSEILTALRQGKE